MQPVISEQEELELAKKLSLGIDSDSLAQLNNKQYADAIDPRFGISNKNLIALKLLSYYSRPEITEKPSEAERLLVQDFLKSVKGDMELNEALTSIAQMSLRGTGISGIVVGYMKVYTYQTRNFRVFTDSFGKLNRNYARAREGLDLIEEDKISLAEYSSVNDMAKLQPIIEDFARKGFFDGDQILEELRNNANESLAILEKMESDFKDSQVAEPGKIAFDHTEKKSFVIGKCLPFFEWLIAKFITKHGHVSKLYHKAQGSFVSHINPEPINAQFDMRSYLYADVYRIKIEALIPAEQKLKLQAAFGDDWLAVVNGMYGEIEREIHDNTVGKFSRLSASSESEQNKAGVVSLAPFGLGHKKFSSNDFNEIREQVFSQFYSTGQHNLLCSEFVAHTTIAALAELNRRLEQKLLEKHIEPSGQIVKIPFGKHEDLHRMHPDRLLHVLKKAGCVEKEKKAPVVSRFFKGKASRMKAAASVGSKAKEEATPPPAHSP